MAANIETRFSTIFQRLATHLRTPLYRNGYALTLSSLGTSAIGVVYWIIAAHQYSPHLIGINSAVISAMMFLAGAAELNLMSALIRFIPTLGRSTKRFVLACYLVSLAIAAVISLVFLLKLPAWSPALQFLGKDPKLAAWFILSTAVWTIFVLQDSVLTGLRQATWVPVENIVFSLVKIALMLVFSNLIPNIGIFASWSLALFVAVLPTNFYIFRELIPAHQRAVTNTDSVEPRQIIRFAAADYIGALAWLICINLMPIIVTTVAGGTANAYYYLSWTIAYALYLIPSSMGSSLVVETAADQQILGQTSYRVFINVFSIVLPAAVLLAIAAPVILKVFGNNYSIQAAVLLRWLALSAVPFTFNAIFVSVARAQRRMRAVIATLAPLSTLALTVGYLLLKAMGIVGVGIAWMIAQTVVASVVYFTQLIPLWAGSGAYSSAGRTVASHITKFDPVMVQHQPFQFFTFQAVLGLIPASLSTRNDYHRIEQYLVGISRSFSAGFDPAGGEDWKVRRLAKTSTGKTVAFLGRAGQPPALVLKVSGDQPTAESMENYSANLLALNNLERLGDWRDLLPVIVSKGVHARQVYIVERIIPGVEALKLIQKTDSCQSIIALGGQTIGELHRKTAQSRIMDAEMLKSWLDRPLVSLRSLFLHGPDSKRILKTIQQLDDELHDALAGKQVVTSWIHGDFAPVNVLVPIDGSAISGIIDWDLAKPDGFPQLDLMHWILSARMAIQHQEMGLVVCSLLNSQDWTPREAQMIYDATHGLTDTWIALRHWLLLAWLQHIHSNLTKSQRFAARHPRWAAQNILPVLRALQ